MGQSFHCFTGLWVQCKRGVEWHRKNVLEGALHGWPVRSCGLGKSLLFLASKMMGCTRNTSGVFFSYNQF